MLSKISLHTREITEQYIDYTKLLIELLEIFLKLRVLRLHEL